VYFIWISVQTANFVFCNIKKLVFIIDVDSVYCAVRTEFFKIFIAQKVYRVFHDFRA